MSIGSNFDYLDGHECTGRCGNDQHWIERSEHGMGGTYKINVTERFAECFSEPEEDKCIELTCTPPEDPKIVYETGFQRGDDSDKIKYTLMPVKVLTRIAKRFTDGGKRYGDWNWRKADPNDDTQLNRFKDAAFRHWMQYLDGETDEDHLAAVACNVMMIMDLENK